MRIHRRSIAGTAARFGTLLLPAALAAATYQWTGTVSDVWSNSNNWSPAGVPASGDDLVFPHNAIRKTTRNNLGNDFRPRSLRFTGATANYVVQGDRIRLNTVPGDTDPVRLIDEHTSGNLRFEADLSIAGALEFQVAGSLGFYGTLTGASLSKVRFTGSGSVETWGPLEGFIPISELPSFTVAGNTENSRRPPPTNSPCASAMTAPPAPPPPARSASSPWSRTNPQPSLLPPTSPSLPGNS